MSSSRLTFTWSGLFIAIIAWALCSASLQAQDSLFYANGQVIVGQVEEVGVDLVRYRTASAGSSVVIVAEKRDLRRVKLAGGQVFVFANVSTDVPASAEFLARKQAISLDVLAPALNHITMGYERVVGRRVSLSLKAGYIGLWERDDFDEGLPGIFGEGGPAFHPAPVVQTVCLRPGATSPGRLVPAARADVQLLGAQFL
jgi:hypothetical protein